MAIELRLVFNTGGRANSSGRTRAARRRLLTEPCSLDVSPLGLAIGVVSAISGSSSSSSGELFSGAQAMMKTPKNVAAHPYMKVTIWWNLAVLKSPYNIAEPMIAERVKKTNCMGITVCSAAG